MNETVFDIRHQCFPPFSRDDVSAVAAHKKAPLQSACRAKLQDCSLAEVFRDLYRKEDQADLETYEIITLLPDRSL